MKIAYRSTFKGATTYNQINPTARDFSSSFFWKKIAFPFCLPTSSIVFYRRTISWIKKIAQETQTEEMLTYGKVVFLTVIAWIQFSYFSSFLIFFPPAHQWKEFLFYGAINGMEDWILGSLMVYTLLGPAQELLIKKWKVTKKEAYMNQSCGALFLDYVICAPLLEEVLFRIALPFLLSKSLFFLSLDKRSFCQRFFSSIAFGVPHLALTRSVNSLAQSIQTTLGGYYVLYPLSEKYGFLGSWSAHLSHNFLVWSAWGVRSIVKSRRDSAFRRQL